MVTTSLPLLTILTMRGTSALTLLEFISIKTLNAVEYLCVWCNNLRCSSRMNAMQKTPTESNTTLQRTSHYLCGPPMMSKTVLDLLHSLGVEDDLMVIDNCGNFATI